MRLSAFESLLARAASSMASSGVTSAGWNKSGIRRQTPAVLLSRHACARVGRRVTRDIQRSLHGTNVACGLKSRRKSAAFAVLVIHHVCPARRRY